MIPSAAVFAAAIEDAEGFPITAMPISPSELYALRLAHARSEGDLMKITGENVLHAPVEQVWDALLDPAVLVAHDPRLRAAGGDRRERLRHDRHRGRRRDQGHLRRHVRALRPRRARVAGDEARRRRRARHDRRDRRRRASPPAATARRGHLRRRRGRRRHGRRRRPADADLGVASGWRASSSATSTRCWRAVPAPVRAAPGRRRRRPAAPARRPGRPGLHGPAPAARRPARRQDDFLKGVAVGAGLGRARRRRGRRSSVGRRR